MHYKQEKNSIHSFVVEYILRPGGSIESAKYLGWLLVGKATQTPGYLVGGSRATNPQSMDSRAQVVFPTRGGPITLCMREISRSAVSFSPHHASRFITKEESGSVLAVLVMRQPGARTRPQGKATMQRCTSAALEEVTVHELRNF